MMGLGKPKLHIKSNLKSLVSAVAEILKGTPQFYGTFLTHDHAHFFFWVGFL